MDEHGRDGRALRIALLSLAAAFAVAAGCAQGVETDGGSGGSDTTVASAGGSGGAVGGQGGAEPLPCGIDCSTIATPACKVPTCNESTGQCEVVDDVDGTACDDELFCTTADSCKGGECAGGPPNDCGMDAPQCVQIVCDEISKACMQTPDMNGAPCQDPVDLCIKGSTCNGGLCTGGTPDDCFFFPVPSDCHEAVCNPMNGMCEAQVGNEGGPCTDPTDLCTVSKTCTMGQCGGGAPKDCSSQTVGCFNGVCDTTNGQCMQVPIMPGQQCAEATDQCNVGICDMNGMCNPQPANQGMPCNDYQNCTQGDVCNSGSCAGTTTITQCIDGDLCCPQGCDVNDDDDCSFCDWNANVFPIASSGSSVADMTFDDNCNLYFTNDGGTVYKVNHNSSTPTILHSFTSSARGLAFNPNDGLLYAAVFDSIWSMTTTGANVTQLPNSNIGSYLNGMTVAPNGWGSYGGWLVVARSSGQVHLVNPASPSATNILGTTTQYISDVEFDAMNGVLYVAAYTQNSVLTLSPSGTWATFASTPCSPDGLAVDPGSFVFIGCGGSNQVHKLAIPGGASSLVASVPLNASWAPAGLIYDGLDNLLVVQESPPQVVALTP